MTSIIGMVIIGLGVLFNLFGCIGIVRFPDVYNRLQAGTKCVTLGVCLILLGAAVMVDGPSQWKALLCIAFILIASPTEAHALSRAARVSETIRPQAR